MSSPMLGQDLYHSPEFKALCKLLGIAWELPTIDMVIDIPCDGVVKITQSYHGRSDMKEYTANARKKWEEMMSNLRPQSPPNDNGPDAPVVKERGP